MTTTTTETTSPAPTPSNTLTPRQHWHRIRPWCFSALFIVATLLVGAAITASTVSRSGHLLNPQSPAPNGAKALAEALQDHGVHLTQRDSLDDVLADIEANPNRTVLLHDRAALLDSDRIEQLLDAGANRVVAINPVGDRFEPITEYAWYSGSIAPEGDTLENDPYAAEHDYPAGEQCPLASKAPALGPGHASVFTVGENDPDAVGCYETGSGSLIVVAQHKTTELIMVGAYEQFTNDRIAVESNAAAAINILGANEELIWYVPGAPDVQVAATPTFNDYVPKWITPVMLLACCSALALMFWRGRRLGPLVAERLPVTVPASETVEGRARLYAKNRSQLHALDAIRIGTLGRLAGLLGLERNASAAVIADAVTRVAQVPRDHAHRVLVTAEPTSDAELVDLANACAEIERRTRTALGYTETGRRIQTPDDPTAMTPTYAVRDADPGDNQL